VEAAKYRVNEYRTEDVRFVHALIVHMWEHAGATHEHADAIAHAVTLADQRGKHSQGVGVLEALYPSWQAGAINLEVIPEIVEEGDSWLVIDGHRSTGYYTLTIGMERAIEKARHVGVCIVLGRNHWDAGGFGAYTLMAAEADMVGIATNTTPPMSTPIGGMSNVMSAAPLSMAAPAKGRPPILVDVKTSETYEGEMSQAVLEGRALGTKILVDPTTGELTDDPAPYRVALEGADYAWNAEYLCAPTFGSHRQQSMNVLVEMLCALVPGGLMTTDVPVDLLAYESPDAPVSTPASFMLVIDPSHFISANERNAKVDRYAAAVKNVAKRPGIEEIYLPGERGLLRRSSHHEIDVLQMHWDALTTWALAFGVNVDEFRAGWRVP
jgi:LDH2 family malate/lactate/ureidoglycolate dehydrogenase